MKIYQMMFFFTLGLGVWTTQGMDNNANWLPAQDGQGNVNIEELDANLEFLNAANEADEEEAMVVAVDQGPNAVRRLLAGNVDVNAGDGAGLYEAARRGDAQTMQVLIDHGVDMGSFATSTLEIAINGGHAHLIPLLVMHGAEVDHAREIAQAEGRHDLVALLDEYNIEPIERVQE